VVSEQALELRIERLVALDAVLIMTLRHPLDVQDRQSDRQGIVRQDRFRNLIRRPDDRARYAEDALELLTEAFEEVNVFRLLARELQQGARPVIIALQLRTGVIHDERQNELLDQSENSEIRMSSDLVQRPSFDLSQESHPLHARQRLRHEHPCVIESLIASDDVFD